MAEIPQPERIGELEQRIAALSARLVEAKDAVQTWVDANASLSRSAASARAENQGAGRGFLGGLLGSKYRSAVRAGAAASNAAIAKDVAAKRARIVEGKRQAQDVVRSIQEALAEAKAELKGLTVGRKARAQTKTVAAKAASTTLDLLQKLKEAHDAGLLTEAEYEEKRRKLVSEL
jgi:cell division septum initiation protein DivIVA